MKNGKTAERVWIEFLLENHRPPTRVEFEELGYKKTMFYKMRNEMPNDYILAQQWVEQNWKVQEIYSDPYKTITFKSLGGF